MSSTRKPPSTRQDQSDPTAPAGRKRILCVAGHIDHGKTALVGALTGVNTDRLSEEQRRGMTIDIGFASLDLPSVHLGIIDAPGHERFIRNMLAGASGASVALLVVAADDSVMPQTVEHLAILQLLSVKHGLVVITKIDLVDEARVELVKREVRELIVGTFLAGAPIVCASARTGACLGDVRSALAEVCSKMNSRPDAGVFRLAVDRSFLMASVGTVVTGTVRSGCVSVGYELDWLPAGRAVKVRGLQTHGRPVDRVGPGQRAAIQLAGVHHREIRRGHELAEPGFFTPTRALTVRLDALKQSPLPIKHRARVRLHLGAGEVMASVRLLRSSTIEPGGAEYAQLLCAEPVVASGGQPFVLRAQSPMVTIGGGVVLLSAPCRLRRNDEETIRWLEKLNHGDTLARSEAIIRFFGLNNWSDMGLSSQANLTPAQVAGVLDKLLSQGRIVRLGDSVDAASFIHQDIASDLARRIKIALARLHEQDPMAPFVPIRCLRQQFATIDDEIIDAIGRRLLDDGELVGTTSQVALATHRPPLSERQRHLRAAILDEHRSARFRPPGAAQLAASLGAPAEEIQTIINLCAGQGELVHLGASVFLHREIHDEMLRRLRDKLLEEDSLTVSQIRDLLRTSRKYAIPICEHLDRIQFTKRRGDVRVLARSKP